ncbi:hypothetical protein [Bradyrhizobium sp. USDA 4486]
MMPALRPIAIARDYSGIHAAFRSYVEEINLSRPALDDLVGWAAGYSSKVLAPEPMKSLTSRTLGEFMQATGLVLVVAQDVEEFARRQKRFTSRQSYQVRLNHRNFKDRGVYSDREIARIYDEHIRSDG